MPLRDLLVLIALLLGKLHRKIFVPLHESAVKKIFDEITFYKGELGLALEVSGRMCYFVAGNPFVFI